MGDANSVTRRNCLCIPRSFLQLFDQLNSGKEPLVMFSKISPASARIGICTTLATKPLCMSHAHQFFATPILRSNRCGIQISTALGVVCWTSTDRHKVRRG